MEAQGNNLRVFPQTGQDEKPSSSGGFPAAMRAEYVKQWNDEHPRHLGKEPLNG